MKKLHGAILGLALLISGCCNTGHKLKQNHPPEPAATQASTTQATTEPATLDTHSKGMQRLDRMQALDEEIPVLQAEVDQKLKPINQLFDPAVRDANAPEALPALQKLTLAMKQKSLLVGDEEMAEKRINLLGVMVLLGDPMAEQDLVKISENKANPDQSLKATLSRLTGLWWRSHSEPAGQETIIEELQKMATADPSNDTLFHTLQSLAGFGAANEVISFKLENVIKATCTSQSAILWKARPRVGDVVEFHGTAMDGTPIDTKTMKGKVVVLSFWATYCRYSRAELPSLAELNAKDKDRGLVLVGVMADDNAEELANFKKDNTNVTWPNVAVTHEWRDAHWGIDGIPEKCIIGRDGRVAAPIQSYSPEDLAARVDALLAQGLQELNK